MSSLWRKFRSTSTSSQPSDTAPGGDLGEHTQRPQQQQRRPSRGSLSHVSGASGGGAGGGVRAISCSPELLSSHSPAIARRSVTRSDEDLFLGGFDPKNDPLQVKAQFVKTVLDILHSPATFPYFIQFLQGWGADKYAKFWLEANSFRAAATSRVTPQSPPTLHTTLPCESQNERTEGVSERLRGEEMKLSKEGQDEGNRDLVLPDLVSNIQNASDVTPIGSPEGVTPDALTCHTPRHNLREGIAVGRGRGGGGAMEGRKGMGISISIDKSTISGNGISGDTSKLITQTEGPELSQNQTQHHRETSIGESLPIKKENDEDSPGDSQRLVTEDESRGTQRLKTEETTATEEEGTSTEKVALAGEFSISHEKTVNMQGVTENRLPATEKDRIGTEKVTVKEEDLRREDKEEGRINTPQKQKQRSIADDALTIYKKYLAKDAESLVVGVDESITQEVGRRILVPKEDVDSDCFLLAQEAVVVILEKEYLPKFLSSDYYLKHQIDVLTSGSVRLADIIYSDSALPYFMEYAEQEGAQAMMQFWVAVSNFRQQLQEANQETHDPMQAQADAMILYDKYFSLQATCPQGFSNRVRFLIEGNICQERGPDPSCFDLPLRVVLHILERDFLPGYLSSGLHISYLSELINTVKGSIELFGRKKRTGSESTCSSEQSSNSVSISTHNTLLAMDSSAAPACRVKSVADPSSMRIDASQLNDPDSLWRRKNFSKLSCGFVNELGRFEAEIEAHPYQTQPSSGLQKIRRLMGREEDKVKEEMAYRVAEMIIKDVTQVTLGPKGGVMPPS